MSKSFLIFGGILFLFQIGCFAKVSFKESTLEEFYYPFGVEDVDYAEKLVKESKNSYSDANKIVVKSFVSQDSPNTILTYYSNQTSQRFEMTNGHYSYVFSEIDQKPASRIEIYPVPIARMKQNYWPTRVDLYYISCPPEPSSRPALNRTKDELKNKAKRLFYDGELLENVATIEQEEMGDNAEVWVVATEHSFTKVKDFFRRRYGRLDVIPARQGNKWVRDFEFDATRAVGAKRKEVEVHIRVDENPMITDSTGNSHVYDGYVFIKYMFWYKDGD